MFSEIFRFWGNVFKMIQFEKLLKNNFLSSQQGGKCVGNFLLFTRFSYFRVQTGSRANSSATCHPSMIHPTSRRISSMMVICMQQRDNGDKSVLLSLCNLTKATSIRRAFGFTLVWEKSHPINWLPRSIHQTLTNRGISVLKEKFAFRLSSAAWWFRQSLCVRDC